MSRNAHALVALLASAAALSACSSAAPAADPPASSPTASSSGPAVARWGSTVTFPDGVTARATAKTFPILPAFAKDYPKGSVGVSVRVQLRNGSPAAVSANLVTASLIASDGTPAQAACGASGKITSVCGFSGKVPAGRVAATTYEFAVPRAELAGLVGQIAETDADEPAVFEGSLA